MQKTITIYGAGYVGLVTGACLAELGHKVLVVDNQIQRINELHSGICPIYEPGLPELIKKHSETGLLAFTTDLVAGVKHGFFQFIAVGTPSLADGSADLHHIFDVAGSIARQLSSYCIIVTKSTVPVGTSQKVSQHMHDILKQRGLSVDFDVVSNPEFLKQGMAVEDFMQPDRIIIGASSQEAFEQVRDLYPLLNHNGEKVLLMDIASAELTKYAANAYLAMRISFMNEISNVAERFGANIDMIRLGIGSDRRIGTNFLMAGCGFGGSCFPKDTRALIKMGQFAGYEMSLVSATDAVNNRQRQVLFKKIFNYFSGNLSGKTIALWGLSFKPNTDDMREAPSRFLIESLLEAGAKIQAYDPVAQERAKEIYAGNPNIFYANASLEALSGADVLAIVTEWDEFKHPDFKVIREKLRYPAVFDGRNLYDGKILSAHELEYYAIGGHGTDA